MAPIRCFGSAFGANYPLERQPSLGWFRISLGQLVYRHVHDRLRTKAKAGVRDLAHDADDLPGTILEWRPHIFADGDVLSNRIAVLP